MKKEMASKRFISLLSEGKIRKNILPNTSSNYTGSAEKKDLIRYKRFLYSFTYDNFKKCEVRMYNGDE